MIFVIVFVATFINCNSTAASYKKNAPPAEAGCVDENVKKNL